MYFNRKNAEQKNWRMIKKGKHFLFGCSLVFAVGASLATQVVHANTAETTVESNSTTGDVNPTQNGDGKTYEAPAVAAVAAKLGGETAKEVKALDKTQLESYIAEIEAKLANGTYESKTEESVAVLKAGLEDAKATLANATTQDEITKAYSKLVTTVNTKLKSKPVEKKETSAVDTTNGKETVGKKAENTEKKSESNSIENTGSNDPRNGKALDKNNGFRAETPKPAGQAPEITSNLNGQASTAADVTVKASAGSTVKLYNKDGVVIGEAVADNNGVATIHPTNSLPEGEITATSTPAGGTESAKSAPITVTKTPLTIKDGGVIGNNDTRLLVSRESITVYPGDKIDVDVIAQATALEKFSVEKNPTAIKGVVPTGGYLDKSRGATIKQRNAKYSGTVAMDQPAGTTSIIFHARNRDKPTTLYRELLVTVLELAKKYEPVTGAKVDVSNSNNLSEDDKNKVIAAVKAANSDLPADSQYSVDEKGNLTITYPDGSKDKIAAAYLVNPTTPAAPVVAPTVEIPFSNEAAKEVYVYGGEESSFDIKIKDDSGKIASATVKQGSNRPFADVAGEPNKVDVQYGFKVTAINSETPATDTKPAILTYSGTPAATDGLSQDRLDAATKGENPAGLALGWRYVRATDTDGAEFTGNGQKDSDPGRFNVILKPQTQKYDVVAPTAKVGVADPANVTEADLAKIKEKLQLEYSKNNDDANLADKKGKPVADKDAKIQSVTKDNKGNLVVTYKDGSQDKKPLSEFVTKETAVVAPTVEVPYSNAAKRQIYVYTGENTDLTFTGKDETTVKDLYLRGPGGVTGVNAADYGFTVGKIDNGAVTNGEGTVSKDKRTATIKMTGVTTLKAPNQWTSFIEAKDSDDAKSMTGADYNATTDDAVRQQKPGYVNFIVKSQTDKYDIKAPTEKVAVTDPANVTEAELAKIKEKLQLEHKKDNDDANISKDAPVTDKDAKIKSVTKDNKGNLVVTYTDGSKDTRPLSEFVGVAPTVEVPYSNADKRQIYVYTGENTDLTFTGKDETTVKDLYLRGPGGVTGVNAADYGFTVGKIDNGAVTNGEGTVSKDKRTATIKMTGVTTLKAPNQWTSFIEAKDNEDIKSNVSADYNASTDDAVRQQKPGYVQFIVKSQTDKYDIKAPTEKVSVADPANVTEADLAKIKEKLQLEHKKDNDDANISKDAPVTDKDAKIKSVTKDNKGNLVVTYADGSKDTKPLSEFVTNKPTDADKNTPTAKPQTVNKGTTPKAEDSIGNVKDLPKGTKVAFKDPVATATPGEKDATVVVTYPDGSKEEVPVKVTVKDPSSPENPTTKDTDGDGLTDKEEAEKGTDPTKADTDGDGVTDKEEVEEGTDPKDPNSKPESPAKPEVKTDLTDKAGTKTPVEVTAEPGSKVELFDKDGNKIGEGVADENGKATITPTKELPAGDVTAKATDPAGNVSEPSVPATATTDTTAPAKPVINTPLVDKAGTKTPVEVSAEPGSKVELFDKDGNKIGEGVADENGKATITPTVELPAGDVTAKATDPAGNVSDASTPATATTDTTAPAKPVINTPLVDKAGTKTPVEVSAEPGSKVELFDKDGKKIGEGVADENGKATITPTVELPAGDVTAKATDPAGNVSEPSVPATATTDTTAPAKPVINTPLVDKAGTKTPVEVSAEPGSKVELFDKAGKKIGEGVADENGKATITPTVELPAGDVTAKATDPAGNVSDASTPATATTDTEAPAKPEVKTDLTGKAGTKDPVEVTAEPGSKVELFDKDGNKIGEGVANENGKATITPTKELPAGDVTAKATDPAGNVSEPSVPATATTDTTAPAKPVINTPLVDKAGTKTPVEVSAEPGSKVELFDKAGKKIGEGVADENGKATITPTVELPAGDVTAKATDPAGNVSDASAPATATTDTEAPAKPEVKTDLTGKAGTKDPVEVTAEPGSKVELFDKDGNKIGEGVADENGKATITPTKELPAGDVTAKATDPAGNVSEPSVPATATTDTEAPAKPEVKTDLTGKAGTKDPVEVTAEPGSKVELFDKDGNKIGEGVADENGKATITPTVELPAGDVTAKATDPAGNVSDASTPATATPDTTAPAKPEIKTDLTDKAGTKTPVEVSAEPGSKVELFDKDGKKIGEGVADENGKATITPTVELPAGDVTAKATDPAGNVSDASTPATATTDTTAPAKPEIKTDLTDKAGTKTPVEVSAEPGSKVELFDKDGNKIGEGVANENGKATITPTVELPAGDVTAKATDPAGNVSDASTPATATTDTTAPAKPVINTPLVDKAGTKTPVEVSAEPGSKVELFDKDGNKIGEGVADENGKATITPTVELPVGDVTAKATDPAGNVSDASTPATATTDTTAPAKPEIKTDLTDKAGTKTPVEVSAEPGSKVELFDKDGKKIGEGVADENGKATITPTKELPAGDVTAKATDPSGNVSEPSVPATATTDTTAPAKPEVKTDLTNKAGTKTPVEVTAEPSSKVELFDKDGNKIGEGVADENGKATITPTVELPAGDVTAKATDPAGNVSEPSVPATATTDTTAPAKPVINTPLVDKAGTKTPVEVSAEPGSKVELFDKDGKKIGEGVADENGKATITPTVELPAGDVTAKATDPAGNVSDASTPATATTDTTAPAKPNAGNDIVKPADKAVVKDPANLTTEEKKAIEDKVKAVNPDATVVVDDKGNATVTTPEGKTAVIPATDLTKSPEDAAKPNAGNDIVKPADKTAVKDPANLTPEEKKAIEDKVKAVNPDATVVVDDKGNATVTTPEGKTAVIPAADLTKSSEDAAKPNAGNDIVKPADKAVVKDPANLTPEEKKAIEDKVKAVNPDATVVVDDKGNATVTTPEGKTAVIPATDLTKDPEAATKPNAGNDIVKPADKTAVKDPANLTPEEKKAIEDKVKAVNPDATVVVDDKGNATVTPKDGEPVVIPAADLTKDPEAATKPNAGNDIVKPADKTAVKDPANLTPEEKKAIEDKVKAVNPDATVVVDDKGNATVTTPEGKTAVIPAADLTKDPEAATKPNAGNDIVKPADKTAVKDPANLTPEEKKAIEDKVKAVNPDATVVVDDKGNATVTPKDGEPVVIPAADLTKSAADAAKPNAGNDIVKPADKTAVKDPAKLTDAEKKAIEDKVKAVNPDATVVVDDKGNATVTTPEGKTAVIPAADLTKSAADAAKPNAGDDIVKPAAKTVVANPAKLTDAEKTAIEDKVKAVNPGAEVVVDDKGNATVTVNGKTAVIPAADLTKSPADAAKVNAGNAVNTPASKTAVKDPANLTPEEKKAIEDKVKAVNPGSTVVVDDKGNATVTTPEGKTAVIPATDLTKSAADADKANAGNAVNTPAIRVLVGDKAKLTADEIEKVKESIKAVNPGATVVVDDKGNATVTTPEGKTATIPAAQLVKDAKDVAAKNNGENINVDFEKETVADFNNLTDAEKEAVKAKIKGANADVVEVIFDKAGNATVITKDGKVYTIVGKDIFKQRSSTNNGSSANAGQTTSGQANARKGAKELPYTGTEDSVVSMVAAAASAVLGLGLAGRRRKEDEEA